MAADVRQSQVKATTVPTKETGKSHFEMIRIIMEAGCKLNALPLTVASASCIYYRFYENSNNCDYDQYLVAGVSLYLAGKVEENHLKIRDVINVCHRIVNRNSETLGYGEEYFDLRDSFVQLELLMLRVLHFKVNFPHPHKYLLHYFWSLSRWSCRDVFNYLPALRTAWAFVQDLLHDPMYLQLKPQHLAVGAIYLSFQCYGIVVPYNGDAQIPWYQALVDDLDEEKVWSVVETIIKNYEQETLVPQRN